MRQESKLEVIISKVEIRCEICVPKKDEVRNGKGRPGIYMREETKFVDLIIYSLAASDVN